jgi:hypothetical protein
MDNRSQVKHNAHLDPVSHNLSRLEEGQPVDSTTSDLSASFVGFESNHWV